MQGYPGSAGQGLRQLNINYLILILVQFLSGTSCILKIESFKHTMNIFNIAVDKRGIQIIIFSYFSIKKNNKNNKKKTKKNNNNNKKKKNKKKKNICCRYLLEVPW